jgi:hypothetical protein
MDAQRPRADRSSQCARAEVDRSAATGMQFALLIP